MPKGHWLPSPPIGVGLVIVLGLILAGILGEDRKEAECRDRAAGQNCGYTLDRVGHAAIPPIDGVVTPPRNPKPEREEWRSEQDLQSQWDQAKWAFWAALATSAGLVVGVIGIFFVKQTLEATRASVEAAHKAMVIQQQIGEAQTRAYLVCDEVEYTVGPNLIEILIRVRNTGNSPADDVMVGGSLGFSFRDRDQQYKSHGFFFNGQPCPSIPGGGQTTTLVFYSRAMGEVEKFDQLVRHKDNLRFGCSLNWKDVFRRGNFASFGFEDVDRFNRSIFGAEDAVSTYKRRAYQRSNSAVPHQTAVKSLQ